MMHAFGKRVELKINVDSDEILLLGHADEAAGKMLQGSLVLNLSEAIKVKSINLSFIGKMKVSWAEGVGHHQHYHKQERTILSHEWEFVKPQLQSPANSSSTSSTPNATPKKSISSTTLLIAGQHKWNFELLLPGNLPQTLESDVGTVSYRLKATIEKSAFIQNTIKKTKNIRIVRCVAPSEFELVQSLEIHNTWAQKMVYDISIPSKLYALSDNIPISFKILPIASHLRVHAIMASIKEYCTYTANGHNKTDTRIVKLVRLDNPFSEATVVPTAGSGPPTWDRVIDLPIPTKAPLCFADADSDMIRIRHRLKFVISLANADGHISELRCAVQIIIVESFAATQELNTLPAYDAMWRSVPYDPQVVETLRTRSSISEAGANEPSCTLGVGAVGAAVTIPSAYRESRQPVNITGWSRLLSVSSSVTNTTTAASASNSNNRNNVNTINEEAEGEEERSSSEVTTVSRPMTILGSNNGSRHHSRRPSIEAALQGNDENDDVDTDLAAQVNNSLSQQSLWWNGMDLGKVPSYRSETNMDPNMLAASLPPAYDSLAAAIANSPGSSSQIRYH